jgi:carbonic anhydrase
MLFVQTILFALLFVQGTFAHPIAYPNRRALGTTSARFRRTAEASSDFSVLFQGNGEYRYKMKTEHPGELKELTEKGQAPPFMFLGCSDSRVSEGTIFNAKPGTLFAERNIANQFHHSDANTHSVLSYAVSFLGVKHIIVMGHYGCGGVAASIESFPKAPISASMASVQNWIDPIRDIYLSSTRPEIVEMREKNSKLETVTPPKAQDPGFRALVEENVKASVRRIRDDSIIANHFASLPGTTCTSESTEPGAEAGAKSEATLAPKHERREEHPPREVFVHGLVYDIETGEIHNLGVSVGPPCVEVPELPWEMVKAAVEGGEAE